MKYCTKCGMPIIPGVEIEVTPETAYCDECAELLALGTHLDEADVEFDLCASLERGA